MNPLQSEAIAAICTHLGIRSLQDADKSIQEQASAIALNFALQTQMLGAANLWKESTRSERDALGGELNLTLPANGSFEVFGKGST